MMWATAARILREHAEELAACVKVKTSSNQSTVDHHPAF
jgi:hypothetical protein